MEKIPKVGVGVLIINRNGKVLLGKRKGTTHGNDTWCPPGGHLEFKESPEACAVRETMEEAGIKITNLKRATFTNDIHNKEDKHYVTIIMTSKHDELSGEPKIMEPDKCEEWKWFSWDDLPSPLFMPIATIINDGFFPEI